MQRKIQFFDPKFNGQDITPETAGFLECLYTLLKKHEPITEALRIIRAHNNYGRADNNNLAALMDNTESKSLLVGHYKDEATVINVARTACTDIPRRMDAAFINRILKVNYTPNKIEVEAIAASRGFLPDETALLLEKFSKAYQPLASVESTAEPAPAISPDSITPAAPQKLCDYMRYLCSTRRAVGAELFPVADVKKGDIAKLVTVEKLEGASFASMPIVSGLLNGKWPKITSRAGQEEGRKAQSFRVFESILNALKPTPEERARACELFEEHFKTLQEAKRSK